MTRSLRPLAFAALLALAPSFSAAAQELKVGDPAPDFTVTWVTAAGTEVFAEVRGKRLPMRVAAMPFAPHRYFRG